MPKSCTDHIYKIRELGNRVMKLQEVFLSKSYSCNSDDHCSMFHFHYKQRSWLQSLHSPDYKSMQQLIQHAPVMKMPCLSTVCCHGPDLRAGCRLPLGNQKSKFGRYHTKETLKFFTLSYKWDPWRMFANTPTTQMEYQAFGIILARSLNKTDTSGYPWCQL